MRPQLLKFLRKRSDTSSGTSGTYDALSASTSSATDDRDHHITNKEVLLKIDPPSREWKIKEMSSLASLYADRYTSTGDLAAGNPADLERAIALQEEVLCIAPEQNADRAKQLDRLATSLRLRFVALDDMADLERAVALGTEALAVADHGADRVRCLKSLAAASYARYTRTNELQDLERTIALGEQVVGDLPSNHPTRIRRHRRQCQLLLLLHVRSGDVDPLNRAVVHAEVILGLLPNVSSERASSLGQLSSLLIARYTAVKCTCSLDRAIAVEEDAVALLAIERPSRLVHLDALALALRHRYLDLGAVADLHLAIGHADASLSRTRPTDRAFPGRAAHLAVALRLLYLRSRRLDRLEQAVDLLETAVQRLRGCAAGGDGGEVEVGWILEEAARSRYAAHEVAAGGDWTSSDLVRAEVLVEAALRWTSEADAPARERREAMQSRMAEGAPLEAVVGPASITKACSVPIKSAHPSALQLSPATLVELQRIDHLGTSSPLSPSSARFGWSGPFRADIDRSTALAALWHVVDDLIDALGLPVPPETLASTAWQRTVWLFGVLDDYAFDEELTEGWRRELAEREGLRDLLEVEG